MNYTASHTKDEFEGLSQKRFRGERERFFSFKADQFPRRKAGLQIETQAWLSQVEERFGQPTQKEIKQAVRSRNFFIETTPKFNVEIKARVNNLKTLEEALDALGAERVGVLDQVDEYFDSPRGRLKIRTHGDGRAEVIFYTRPDTETPKGSTYQRFALAEPEVMAQVLGASLGRMGRVGKRRLLYLLDDARLLDRTRVHLDTVRGLGRFMELEVVLDLAGQEEKGRRIAEEIMDSLNITQDSLVAGSYIDLVRKSRAEKDGLAQGRGGT